MTMKSIHLKTVFCSVLLSALFLHSCSLEEYNPGAFTNETLATSTEGYETLINQCYFAMERFYYGAADWMSLTEGDTDLWTYKANQSTSYTEWFWFFAGTSPNTTYTNNWWNGTYDGIGSCNEAIALGDKPPYATEEERNAKVAEARFMRAVYYFNAVEQFGGVTMLTEPETSLNYSPVRTDPMTIYKEVILPDLRFASEWLPIGNHATTTTPTKKAALGFLAKACLQTYEYGSTEYLQEALDAALQLISDCESGGGKYNTYMYPTYSEVFEESNNWENKEALWKHRWYAGTDGHGSSNGNYKLNRNDEYFLCDINKFGAREDNQETRLTWEGSISGIFMPTQHLLNLYVQNDGTLDPRFHQSFTTQWKANKSYTWDESAVHMYDKDETVIGKALKKGDPVIKFIMREETPEVVLLDMNFTSGINTGNEGLFWLHEIKKVRRELPVVLFTAYADIDLAIRGIKEGASDFIVKPWNNQKLVETLQAAASSAQQERKTGNKKEPVNTPALYWGESKSMQQLRVLIEKVASTDANILITGENGTGKEMLAREIHTLSNRRQQEMITVDMGAITESLFESELFGHVKGSFTDAHTDRTGKFEAADHSTLFLDEIGNLPYHLQAKLLTAIQRRSIVRVGSNTPIPIDIRLICATNRNLQEMADREEFREDLLYRINTIHIEIPPLRERKEDIVPLAERFIIRFCKQYDKEPMKFSPAAKEKLTAHPWYGNIRELEHAIEKVVIINDGVQIPAELFQLSSRKTETSEKNISTLEEMEVQMIRKALDACAGNLSAVAAQLGITRQTLYNKMKKFGL